MNKNVSKGGLIISSVAEAQTYLQNGVNSFDRDIIKRALMHLNLEALRDPKLSTKLMMHADAFLSCMNKNQSLYKCSVQSLAGAFLQTFNAGLSVSPEHRQCYIVPYLGQAQIQIGYVAYVSQVAKEGKFIVSAEVVLEGDKFEMFRRTGKGIEGLHVPRINKNKYQDKILGAYALLTNLSGVVIDFEWLSWEESENLRLRNSYQKNASRDAPAKALKGAWLTDTAAMIKAKVSKQLLMGGNGALDLIGLDERAFVQDVGGDVLEAEIYEDAEQIEIQPTAQQDWEQISKDVLASWEKAETPKEKNAIRKDFFAKLTAANLPDTEKIAIRPFFEKIPQQSE